VAMLLTHNVFFALKDRSDAAKQNLLAACRKYLTNHAGTVFFCCGTLAEDLKRPVNVRDFEVGLHVIFESQAAHDAYQMAQRHQQFITENKDNWASVRVFDTLTER